jgi:hypothetical protein
MRIALIFCLSVFLLSCKEGIRSREHGTRLNSQDYPDKKERIAVFSSIGSTHSPIKDIEFDLFNVNDFGNNRSVPGASSLHYRYVVKVDPADVHLWTEFLQPINMDTSFAWQDSLVSSRKEEWIHASVPQFYGVNGKLLVIAYQPEGIIFRDVIQN